MEGGPFGRGSQLLVGVRYFSEAARVELSFLVLVMLLEVFGGTNSRSMGELYCSYSSQS